MAPKRLKYLSLSGYPAGLTWGVDGCHLFGNPNTGRGGLIVFLSIWAHYASS